MNPRNGVDAHIVAAVYIDSGAFDGELPPGTSKATRRAVDAVLQSSGSERLASLRGAVKPAELEEILRLVGNPRPIHGTSGKSNGHRLSFVKASDVEPEQVEWLWKGRIARGKITILEGDPGTGKTTLALSLAACISNGDPLPGEQDGGRPRTVIVFSGEDDIGDTLRPRLDAAGADCSRVIFENLRDPDAVPFMLPRDLDELERTIIEHDAALVIIDPVLSYLDPDTDSHKDQSVRAALMPLAALAQRTRVSIILIRHLNKDSSKSAIHRGEAPSPSPASPAWCCSWPRTPTTPTPASWPGARATWDRGHPPSATPSPPAPATRGWSCGEASRSTPRRRYWPPRSPARSPTPSNRRRGT